MAKNEKKRFPWIRWGLLLLALISLYHVFAGKNGILKLQELGREKHAAPHRADSLAIRKQELAAEKNRLLTDSAYLEKLARQELGMAKPKEKVYRFVSPGGKSESPAK